MKQPFFERMIEGIPLRGYVRERMEVGALRALTEVGRLGRALHIASGDGEATALILKRFEVEAMQGIDRDGETIARARERRGKEGMEFAVGEATAIPSPDACFDAVFDLAELHNLRDWRRALAEVHRVLKPGGLLLLEELSRETFAWAAGRLFKVLTEHPYGEMFDMEELRSEAVRLGFEILAFEERIPLGLLKYYLLVARKV